MSEESTDSFKKMMSEIQERENKVGEKSPTRILNFAIIVRMTHLPVTRDPIKLYSLRIAAQDDNDRIMFLNRDGGVHSQKQKTKHLPFREKGKRMTES